MGKRGRPSSWKKANFVNKKLKQAAGSVIRQVSKGVGPMDRYVKPMANKAVQYAVKSAKNWASRKFQSYVNKKLAPKKRTRYYTQGKFVGKFRAATAKSGRKWTEFNKKGINVVNEITGTVADPDCVYMSVTAIEPNDCISRIADAIIRRMLEKAGYRVNSYDDPLSVGSTEELKLELEVESPTGITVTNFGIVATYGALSNCTTTWSGLYIALRDYSCGYTTGAVGDSGNLTEFGQLRMMRRHADNDSFVLAASMHMKEIEVLVKGKMELKVQNRTKAADGSADAEDVSSNPLQGRLYYFRGIPRPKNNTVAQNVWQMCPINGSGVRSIAAATLYGDSKEPMNPNYFWNCTSSSKVRLDPGDIKNCKLNCEKKMNLLTLLKKMRLQFGTESQSYSVNYNIFPHLMLALEDVINVSPTENIAVAFEAERTLGVIVSEKIGRYMRTKFVTSGSV